MPSVAPNITFNTIRLPESNISNSVGEFSKEVTWDIEGKLKGDTAAVKAAWDTLSAALVIPGGDFKILTDADVVVMQTLASDCIEPPCVTVHNVTEKREGFLVTNIQFTLQVRAVEATSSSVVKSATLNLSIDKFGFLKITEQGNAISKTPFTAAPDSFISLNSNDFVFEQQFNFSENRRSCFYTYTWDELRRRFPDEIKDLVADFSFQISEDSVGNFTSKNVQLSGSMTLKKFNAPDSNTPGFSISDGGSVVTQSYPLEISNVLPINSIDSIEDSRIKAAVDWIKTGIMGSELTLRNHKIDIDLWTGTISFNFNYVRTTGSIGAVENVVKFTYSISISGDVSKDISSVKRFGTTPVMQELGYPLSTITEQGEVITTSYPRQIHAVANYVFADDKKVTKLEGDTGYKASFSFTYKNSDYTWQEVLDILRLRIQIFGN